MRSRSVLFLAALCSSFAFVTPAVAQSDRPAIEVGGQVTLLRLTDSSTTSTGFGGRFSVNLFRWLSVDTEMNYFPSDDFKVAPSIPDPPPPSYQPAWISYQRRRTELLAGARIGYRGDRWGLFGKVRPGFTHLTNEGINCAGAGCALMLFAVPEYRTEFALDLGGVAEFYPTRRTVARFDFGDTMIRHRSTAVPPCAECTSHNFTSRIGIGLKF
jgi:hypothetical protein